MEKPIRQPTLHEAVVTVVDGNVASAMIDNRRDELGQKPQEGGDNPSI